MNALLLAVQAIINKREENEAKLIAQITEANGGNEPKIGKGGRLHAPVNGYVHGEDVYKKGQFINEEIKQMGRNKVKVVVTVALGTELKQILSTGVSFGSTWQEDGKTVSYAYIDGLTLTEYKLLAIFAKSKTKHLMLQSEVEEQGLNASPAYKFNFRKVSYMLNMGESFYVEYMNEYDLWDKVDFKYNPKTGKNVWSSIFKGQMVAVVYKTTNAYLDL